MKIARIETFQVPPRWLFLRIETDDGVVGWGEPVVEGRSETVAAAVAELGDYLMGADPLRIEDHWQVLTKGGFYRGGPVLSSAVAGIDQALWDITGKVRDAPVHELLGGPVRDRVRVYGWVGGDEPAELADAIAEQVEHGLTAVKMNASGRMPRLGTMTHTHGVVERAAIAREALGPDRDFAMDFHGRMSIAQSRRTIGLLADYHPLFVEEPVLPEQTGLIGQLVAASPVPIALGERLFARHEFLPPLQAGVAVVQPDLSHAGGISETRRIASLAEVFGALLAPHCPLGPIALAACLQVDFATPNFLIQEQSGGIHYNTENSRDIENSRNIKNSRRTENCLLDYLVDPAVFQFTAGHIERPTGPGLGIAVDEKAVREAARRGHRWRSPVWRYEDGSLAEW